MTADADIAGLGIKTPPAKQRNLDDIRASPTRTARNIESHREALRKLTTAVVCSVHTGATWDEIMAAVTAGVTEGASEGQPCAVLSATARAFIHDGDDRL